MHNSALRHLEKLHSRNTALDGLIAALHPHDPEFVARKLVPRARRGAATLNADLSRYIAGLLDGKQ